MEPNPYGTGAAGGKIRRRTLRATASTPYDRPSAPAVATAEPSGRDGWLSRLVDPASQLIYGGASRFISSFLDRFPRLTGPGATPLQEPEPQLDAPAPASIAGNYEESSRGIPEGASSIPVSHPEAEKSLSVPINDKVFGELEQLLLKKTFTRAEFDYLTNLMRSRTVEPIKLKALSQSINDEMNKPSFFARYSDDISKLGGVSNHVHQTTVPVDEYATPAELAKAYMHSSATGSSSINLLHRSSLEKTPELSHKIYDMTVLGEPGVSEMNPFPGSLELLQNGYTTPRLAERSAIYRMARTPYFKGASFSKDSYSTPLSSWQTPAYIASGNKMSLKRRSAALDPDIGSSDSAIRRIRQKTNMMSSLKGIDTGSRSVQCTPSFNNRLPENSQVSIATKPLNVTKDTGNDKFIHQVPPSSRTAEKIFKHLDKMTPSPKDKLFEIKPDQSELLPTKRQALQLQQGEASTEFADLQQQELKIISPDDVRSVSAFSITRGSGLNLNNGLRQNANCSSSTAADLTLDSAPDVKVLSQRRPRFHMNISEVSVEVEDDQQQVYIPISSAATASSSRIPQQKCDSKVEEQNGPAIVDQKVTSKISSLSEQEAEVKILDQLYKEKVVEDNGDSNKYVEKPYQFSFNKDTLSSSSVLSARTEDKAFVSAEDSSSFSFPLMPSTSAFMEPPPTPTMPSSPPPIPANGNGPCSVPVFSVGAKNTSTPAMGSTSANSEGNISVDNSSTFDGLDYEKGAKHSHDGEALKPIPNVPATSSDSVPLVVLGTSTLSGLSNGISPSLGFSVSSVFISGTEAGGLSVSPPLSTNKSDFATKSATSPVSSVAPACAIPSFGFSSGTSMGLQVGQTAKSGHNNVETKPILFGSVDGTFEDNVSPLLTASTSAPSPLTQPALSTGGLVSTAGLRTTAFSSSNILPLMPGVQSVASAALSFSTAGNSTYRLASAAQPFTFVTSAVGSTSSSFASSTLNSQSSTSDTVSLQTSTTASSTSIFTGNTPETHNGMSQSSQSSAGIFGPATGGFASGFGSVFGSTTSLSNSSVSFSFSSSPSASSVTPQTMAAPSLFGSSSAPSSSSFSSTFAFTSSSSNPFSFEQSTLSASSQAPLFSFTAAASTASFLTSGFGPGNNTGFVTSSPGTDEMNEDTMADDNSQTTTAVPLLGQPPSTAAPVFGSTAMPPPAFGTPAMPLGGTPPFAFSSNPGTTPQSPISFQAGAVASDFQGTFSLGSGGVDKSNRRFIKVTGRKQRKK